MKVIPHCTWLRFQEIYYKTNKIIVQLVANYLFNF